MRLLITAGGTREALDPVRFISNASTGKMGYALARAALQRGHQVCLVSAPTVLRPPRGATLVPVVSAAQMWRAVKRHLPQSDGLIMAAAVSDYTPAQVSRTKIKKGDDNWSLTLVPTVDILREVARWRAGRSRRSLRWVVGFALEDRDRRRAAERKLRDKNLDMIVANGPQAIGADASTVEVLCRGWGWIRYPAASKLTQARRIIRLVERHAGCAEPSHP